MNREERIKAAEAEIKKDIKSSQGSSKNVLDWGKIGGFKKELIYKPDTREGSINKIDILPYISSKNNISGIPPGTPTYKALLWIHRYVGEENAQCLCLNKHFNQPCPICEDREEKENKGLITDGESYRLKPKQRGFYNILDRMMRKPVQIFEESTFLFQKELGRAAGMGDKVIVFHDIEIGKTVEFLAIVVNSEEGKHTQYRQFSFLDRQPYDERIYKHTYCLDDMIHIPTYEEVRDLYFGAGGQNRPVPNSPNVASHNDAYPADLRSQDASLDDLVHRDAPVAQPVQETHIQAQNCPAGHVFGTDCENHVDCVTCPVDIYNKCKAKGTR